MTKKLLNVEWRYNGGSPILKKLFWDGKIKEVKEEKIKMDPYLFLKSRHVDDDVVMTCLNEADEHVEVLQDGRYANTDDDFCHRVECSNPYSIKDMGKILNQNQIDNYEADLNYLQRVMIDNEIQLDIPSPEDVLYFDIEADARDDIDIQDPEAQLLSISATDTQGNERKFGNEGDEVEMINEFLKFADGYPVWAGYFSRTFDWPLIQNKCENLGIDYDFSKVVHFDVFAIYSDVLKKNPANDGLDFVADLEGFSGKTANYNKSGDFYDAWKNDYENFLEYNLQDARLTMKLSKKYEMTRIFFSMLKHTHTTPWLVFKPPWVKSGRTINYYRMIESLVLKLSQKRNPRVVWPTRDFSDKKSEGPQFSGADVFESVGGLHEHVIKLDFASLYVNLIRNLNIGLTSMDKNGDIHGLEANYDSSSTSIFSEAIEHLNDLRNKWKEKRQKTPSGTEEYKVADAQQFGIKNLSLSTWGCLGYEPGRFYDETVSEEITGTGKEVMRWLREFLENKGHTVITGDTDSSTVKINIESDNYIEYSKKLAEEATKYVENKFSEKHNVDEPSLAIEFEKYYKRFYMPESKKRYAGMVLWDDGEECLDWEIVGFEFVRGDWPKPSKNFQEKLIHHRLKDSDNEKVREVCRKYKRKLYNGEFDDQLVTWTGLNQKIEEYDNRTPYVTAAKQMIDDGYDVGEGDKIPFIKYGDDPEDVVACPGGEVPDDVRFDRKYLWKKKFKAMMDRIGYGDLFQTNFKDFEDDPNVKFEKVET